MAPNLIHIPSNGLLTDVIEKRVGEILEELKGSNAFLTIKLFNGWRQAITTMKSGA